MAGRFGFCPPGERQRLTLAPASGVADIRKIGQTAQHTIECGSDVAWEAHITPVRAARGGSGVREKAAKVMLVFPERRRGEFRGVCMLRLKAIIFSFAAAMILAPCHAMSQPIEIKFAHVGGPGSLYWASAEEFARRANERLNGVAVVKVYPRSELGSDSAVLKKLLTGEVHLGLIGTPMSSVADEFGVFEMPFLVRDREHVKRFRERILHGYLSPATRRKGYLTLGMWELGFRHITNNVRPIEGPESLNGVRLRVPAGPWRTKMFEAYGVKTTTLEFKDVYPQIAAGNVDGLETPLDLIYSAKIHEIQKYVTLSYHLYSPAFFVTGLTTYAQLPEAAKTVIAQLGRDMQDWVLAKAEEIDADLLRKFGPGVQINEADCFAFTIQSLPIYQEFVRDLPVGKAMVRLIFEADPSAMPSALLPDQTVSGGDQTSGWKPVTR
jgi:tripartite ATP-independent transporter DctP family solute receptor